MEFYILHCTMCKFVLYMQNVTNQLSVTVTSLKLKTFVAMTTMAWLCGYDMFLIKRPTIPSLGLDLEEQSRFQIPDHNF